MDFYFENEGQEVKNKSMYNLMFLWLCIMN